MKKILITLSLALVSIFASAHKVTVKVNGVDNSNGNIGVAAYTKDNFRHWNKATAAKLIPATAGTTSITLDLPDGTYAFAVIHDENANHDVDMDEQGVPTEPTGFSNNPVLKAFPTFEQVSTTVKDDKVIEIQLVRYK